jgi:hypothetical protein
MGDRHIPGAEWTDIEKQLAQAVQRRGQHTSRMLQLAHEVARAEVADRAAGEALLRRLLSS